MKAPQLSGWGRTFVPGQEQRSEDLAAITPGATLSRGLGRSYGDASLPAQGVGTVVGTTLADRILGFDDATGVLRAEAGICLAELNRIFLPRGFFTPITPGTKYVTLGGMVASDVHGKNHHVDGTIGRHVRAIKLRVGDGRVIECSREHERALFLATLGGMGLTGHILEVELVFPKIPSPWIYQEVHRVPNLDTYLRMLKESGEKWPYTVGWIDTVASGDKLGRGILFCGRWAEPSEAPAELPKPGFVIPMPLELPSIALNRFTIGAFNTALYTVTPKHKISITSPDKFFYPLDRIRKWNKMYGKRGVTQHQCVLPNEHASSGVRALFDAMRQHGACSFLTVIKDCGAEGEGMLSFPRPGISVALDIPIRDNIQAVIDALNAVVMQCGGRIYLTKDGFTRAEHFAAMDPRVPDFLAVRRRYDPQGTLRSAQSERMFGTGK